MKFLINTVLLLCLIFCVRSVNAMDGDAGRITISGTISDGKTGEMLLGATIYVKELASGTTSNLYGFYSFSFIIISLIVGPLCVMSSFKFVDFVLL